MQDFGGLYQWKDPKRWGHGDEVLLHVGFCPSLIKAEVVPVFLTPRGEEDIHLDNVELL
jgi:hypothetical protein